MNPKKTAKCFLDQHDDEEVILVVRRSFIVDLIWVIASVLLLIFFVNFKEVLYLAFGLKWEYPLITFLQFSFCLFVLTFILNKFFNWFYTINIITNERIIDIDFDGIGTKNVVETQIKNIQSVTVKNTGFTSFIFGLSTIQILTSGDNPNIDFDYISDSNRVYNVISELTRNSKKDGFSK